MLVCPQESIDILSIDKSNMLICPQESIDIASIKKINKKVMTEQWLQSQCDAFSSVTPRDLTPLSVSPVCIEEFSPEIPAGDDGLGWLDGVKENESAQSFLTANESTLPGEHPVEDCEYLDTGNVPADADPLFKDAFTESFVG